MEGRRKGGTRGGREDRKEGWNWPLPFGEGVWVEAEAEEVDRLRGDKRRGGWGGGGRGPCAIRSCLCLSVCLFSHSRNQFAIRTVTVEQREKEACQVGHIQREMERDKTGTRGTVEFRRSVGGGVRESMPPHLQLQLQTHLPWSGRLGFQFSHQLFF